MKLEGELAYCHPNIGLEPESESFEFNDSDPDSIVCKSKSGKVMDNDKRISFDLKSNDGNTVPTKYSMEEFDSEDTEVSNAKRSHDVWINDSPDEFDSCENSEDTYSDECVTESQPELLVCCKESNCHIIKDICVDEGVSAMYKGQYENRVDEKPVSKVLPFETSKTEVLEKGNSEISAHVLDVLDLAVTKEFDKVPAKLHQSEDLIQRDDNSSEHLANQNKEMVLSGGTISLPEIEPEVWPSPNKGDEDELNHATEVCGEPASHSKHEQPQNKVEEAVLTNPLVNELDRNFVPANSVAYCSEEKCKEDGSCKCNDFQDTAKPEDGRSITGQVSHCNGESSFSAVVVSSHICYSGSVPFSGNISHRSDSSTTSMRSFAFPVLQNEWECSPVRMAKANKRHHRNLKSWIEGLLCCKF